MGRSRHDDLNQYARDLIGRKARQLVGRHGFTRDDEEDLQQEMTLRLILRLPKFDARKAKRKTYTSRALDRIAVDLIRFQKREKRDCRLESYSLDERIGDGEGHSIRRGETLSQDEYDFRTEKHTRPESERCDMSMDVWAAISELPQDLEAVTRLLPTHSISEVARVLGLHRDTIHRDRLVRLREIFEDKGLREYH